MKRLLQTYVALLAACGPDLPGVEESDSATQAVDGTTEVPYGSSTGQPNEAESTATDAGSTDTTTGASDASTGTGDAFGSWGTPELIAELQTPRGFHPESFTLTGSWIFASTRNGDSMTWRIENTSLEIDTRTGGSFLLFATGAYVYPYCGAFQCSRFGIDPFTETTTLGAEIVAANGTGALIIRSDGPTARRPIPTQVLSWRADAADVDVDVFSSQDLTRVFGMNSHSVIVLLNGDLVAIDTTTWTGSVIIAKPTDLDDATGSAVSESHFYASTPSGICVLDLDRGQKSTIEMLAKPVTIAAAVDRVAWVDQLEATHVWAADAEGAVVEDVASTTSAVIQLALGTDALY